MDRLPNKIIIIAVCLLILAGAGGYYLLSRESSAPAGQRAGLSSPAKKEIAMRLVSSAENSSTNWKGQYGFIAWNVEKNDKENRGYTAGIIGFCSGCGDMTKLLETYNRLAPGNVLEKYLPAVQVQELLGMGQVTKAGLGGPFEADWKAAAEDPLFRQAQDVERDRGYFDPAASQGKADGLRALGQFLYYDALVMHGPGDKPLSFGAIREDAVRRAKLPAQGGDEAAYLNAFLDARTKAMKAEIGHSDTSRIDDMQRKFVREGKFDLEPPLEWSVYGDRYRITSVD